MKFTITFLLLGVSLTIGAWRLWPTSLLLAAISMWAAIAYCLLSVAYAWNRPGMLGKLAAGRRRLVCQVLFWRYLGLSWLTLSLYVVVTRQERSVEVFPNLTPGRRLFAGELADVPWTGVLDLAAEFQEACPLTAVPDYRSVPVLDAMPPSLAQLAECVAWLQQRVPAGPVYVHCALGHSRSATVVAAWLVCTGLASDVPEAERRLQALRPGVQLHENQRLQLARFLQTR